MSFDFKHPTDTHVNINLTISFEQLKQFNLSTKEIYDFNYNDVVLFVRDGIAGKCQDVWWWSDEGPIKTTVDADWVNIRRYPEFYSIKEPKVVDTPYYTGEYVK